MPAHEGGLALGGRLVGVDVDRLQARGGRLPQLFAHGGEAGAAMAVGQQAVVPDAVQAGGQHVQQEAAHELGDKSSQQADIRRAIALAKSLED